MKDLLGKDNRVVLMGIAILLITFHHFAIYGAGSLFSFFRKGNIGVDIFFFLSAYGCCFSYDHNSIKSFYLRRIKRLFPVYLLFLIIYILFFRLDDGLEKNVVLILAQISGLSIFGFEEAIAWYIPSTILLYITFPLLFFFFRFIKQSFCLQVTYLIVSMLIAHKLPIIMNTALAMRVPIIGLGFLSYFNRDNSNHLSILLIISIAIGYFIPNLYVESVVVPMLIFVLGKSDICFSNSLLSFFGRHSLEIYLAQYIAIGTLLANRGYNFLSENLYIQLLCAIVLLFVLASVLCFIHRAFWRFVR